MEFFVKSCVSFIFFMILHFYKIKDCQRKSNLYYYFRSQDSEVEGDSNGDLQIASPGSSEAQQALAQFWPKVTEEIKKITTVRNSYTSVLHLIIFLKTNVFADGLKNTIFTIGKDKENYET